jgi:D-serine deaminase-like pyridoxal phosphate-dependent protein
VDTPSLTVDLDAVERNISRTQGYCDEHSLAFHPHAKTHKSAAIARLQLDAGAAGLACQTVEEAEALAGTGVADLTVCLPALGTRAERLARLARVARITSVLDSTVALDGLSRAAQAQEVKIDILVECDTGGGRAGVQHPSQAAELAAALGAAAGLNFAGLLTHPAPPGAAEWLAEAKRTIEAAGTPVDRVSVGGTPTATKAHEIEVATELRAGTYVFGDRACVHDGSVPLEDCAVRVLATVVSRPAENRAIIDAGSKSLTSDPAFGLDDGVFGAIDQLPGARLVALSEEHGIVELDGDGPGPGVGERLSVLPNHVCPAVNLHDRMVVHRGGDLVATWPVLARRR